MPFLTEIEIKHYRGFYGTRKISPAVPNGTIGSGLTVLVGPNNSGKSTVFAAIRSVIRGARQIDIEHRHAQHALHLTLTNDSGEQKTITNPDLGASTILIGNQSAFPNENDVRIVPSRRAWSSYTGTDRMTEADYWNRQVLSDEQDNYLVSRIAVLTQNDRGHFVKLLKSLMPHLSTWRIELSRGQTFIEYETQTGARHSADLFGDGMASLFRVALSLNDSTPGKLLLIDEPELSLHPQAQKTLASVLSRYSADRQIIVTTHSPYFVSWADVANGARVYRLSQKKDGIAVGSLHPDTVENLRDLTEDWQKPNLLDAVSREVFFAEEVVFLEGQEDVGLLRKFCDENDVPPLSAFGYGAGGFGNISRFLDMAEDLGIPAVAVYDGEHAATADEMADWFPDALVKTLAKPDMRDKPARDKNNKETDEIAKEGIFDRKGIIKPEYKQYRLDLIDEIGVFLKAKD